MRFIVMSCDWSDNTTNIDNWFIASVHLFDSSAEAVEWVNQEFNPMGFEWVSEDTFVNMNKDEQHMGTWRVMPFNGNPTCTVDQEIWSW
jgi:hypothetical protein